jgi:hypothetical protein
LDRRILIIFGIIFTLSANIIALFFIEAKDGHFGRSRPRLLKILTGEDAKKMADPMEAARIFYEALRIGRYDRVYQMLHPQVQAEISQEEFVEDTRKALNGDGVVFMEYKLGAERSYEAWRSHFDPQKRTYHNVREIEVVLSGKEKDKPLRIPGVLILAPMDDGTWRVLRL